jgi:hypothetical protein
MTHQISELKKRTFIVEHNGHIVGVRESNKPYSVSCLFPLPDSCIGNYIARSFHSDYDHLLSYYNGELPQDAIVAHTTEIFTKQALKDAKSKSIVNQMLQNQHIPQHMFSINGGTPLHTTQILAPYQNARSYSKLLEAHNLTLALLNCTLRYDQYGTPDHKVNGIKGVQSITLRT